MNHQESLTRLEKEKEELQKKVGNNNDDDDRQARSDRRKLELTKKIIEGYSRSFASEMSEDKMKQVFDKVFGFEKQKEEATSILLLQKYFSAKGIKDPEGGKVLCFVGPPGTGKTYFARKFAEAIGRKFFKINLGGASDATIISGGRRHFV